MYHVPARGYYAHQQRLCGRCLLPNNSSGSILVSYAVREPGQAVSIQQIRLNLNRQTTVTNAAGQNSCICCIRKGTWVNVGCSPAMTRSIPASVQRLLGCDPEDTPGPGSAGAAGSSDSASAARAALAAGAASAARTALASGSAAAAQTSGAANSAQAPSPQTSGASHAAPAALLHDHRQNRPD